MNKPTGLCRVYVCLTLNAVSWRPWKSSRCSRSDTKRLMKYVTVRTRPQSEGRRIPMSYQDRDQAGLGEGPVRMGERYAKYVDTLAGMSKVGSWLKSMS
jgi:hypothetical protein